MPSNDFEKEFIGTFEPDYRFEALCTRLGVYYKHTADLGNKEAKWHWKLFIEWCTLIGYTSKEIHKAKRHPMFKNV